MVLGCHQRPALQRLASARHGRETRDQPQLPLVFEEERQRGQEQRRVLLREAAQAAGLALLVHRGQRTRR